jgi:hypothetical protein
MNPDVTRQDDKSKRERRRQEMLETSKDPLFLADSEEIERDFLYADAEAARLIDQPRPK